MRFKSVLAASFWSVTLVSAIPQPQAAGGAASIRVASAYTDAKFGGKKIDLTAASIPTGCLDIDKNFDNQLSSLQLTDAKVTCVFWIDNRCGGNSMTVTGAQGPVLDLSYIPAGGLYNDALSSYSCRYS
ncbi:hypothetical protein DL96DRAFT_1643286 [Flagelloscypha sp. PMI_526]|nr:hypothetical protein DL96DRAFT_1643286 [Flagelloscypha sp. PMI_526]